jgi:cyclopropane-fatty-acyl-phospholipid synthase
MEHIGTGQLASHFATMAAWLKPGGRMLNHTITRASNHQSQRASRFIDRYVFPDGELQSPGTIIGTMHDAGFEIRHVENLREHYAMTLRAWGNNLEEHWAEAVAQVGVRRARVWRLYIAISRLGFERNRVQIHQMLAVNTAADGRSGMPLRPDWERASERAPALA